MENFKTYPKIYTIGHLENKEIFSNPNDEIVIEEKIDGANFRFMIKDDKVIFGSRTQQITSDKGEDTNVAKNFKSACDYVRDNIVRAKEQWKLDNLKEYEGLIFYCEACHKHTMNYNWEIMPRVIGFDVYKISTEAFMELRQASELFESLDMKFVPIIDICEASKITKIDDSIVPVSKYAPISNPKQLAEGVVFKNYTKQIFAKYVRNEFKERNSEAFGGNPKYNKEDDTDNAEFVFKYCTNARIDKIVFKLVDDGNKLDMPLMSLLPKMVYNDIIEENWREILESKQKLDLLGCRKLITKRCLAVLKQIIVNNVR